MRTSHNPTNSIEVGIPVVCDERFEFIIERLIVDARDVLRGFGGFGGG